MSFLRFEKTTGVGGDGVRWRKSARFCMSCLKVLTLSMASRVPILAHDHMYGAHLQFAVMTQVSLRDRTDRGHSS
jgi:hypothetical protein